MLSIVRGHDLHDFLPGTGTVPVKYLELGDEELEKLESGVSNVGEVRSITCLTASVLYD